MQNELANRTPAEREIHIQFFMSLPLKKLRHRQDLVNAQKRAAFARYEQDKKSEFRHVSEGADAKWNPVFEQLDQMWDDLFEAIDRKCFPQPKWASLGKEQPAYGATN